jgi:hypothetical protein
VRKKTGEQIPDIDRQTLYLFDFILEMYTEDNKKKQVSNHIVRIDGTRHKALPKYSIHDITGKLLYEELFKPIEDEVRKGAQIPQDGETGKEEEAEPEDIPPAKSMVESVRDIKGKFGSADMLGFPIIEKDQPEATAEDRKVLFTRANAMTWPDNDRKCRRQSCKEPGHLHADFTSDDAKTLIKGHYNVESTKELRKPQVDFLYTEFGKVLAGMAYLDRDEKDIPYVATPSGVNTEEVRARVELEFGVK